MYFVKVAQLDNASLQSLWFHLQDEIHKVDQLYRLVETVKCSTGGALLQQLYEIYASQGYCVFIPAAGILNNDSGMP